MRSESMVLFFVTLAFGWSATADSGESSNLKAHPKPSRQKIESFESEAVDAALETELEEADVYSYETAAKGANEEESRLKNQIENYNTSARVFRTLGADAKKRSKSAYASMDSAIRARDDAKKRHAVAQKEKERAETESKAAEAKLRLVTEETRKYDTLIRLAKEERLQVTAKSNRTIAAVRSGESRNAISAAAYKRYRETTRSIEAGRTR